MKIGQFQKIFELKDDKDSLDYKIKAVSILTGKSQEEIEDLPIDDFKALANSIVSLDKISDKLHFTTKVYGIKFEAMLTAKQATTAEAIELSSFTKDEQTIIKNLHKLMAIFYKPKSKWFGLKKVNMSRSECAELFKEHMDIEIAYPLAVFFLKSLENFSPIIQGYLEKKMKEIQREMKKKIKVQEKWMRKNT